jgi:hypothetical protein
MLYIWTLTHDLILPVQMECLTLLENLSLHDHAFGDLLFKTHLIPILVILVSKLNVQIGRIRKRDKETRVGSHFLYNLILIFISWTHKWRLAEVYQRSFGSGKCDETWGIQRRIEGLKSQISEIEVCFTENVVVYRVNNLANLLGDIIGIHILEVSGKYLLLLESVLDTYR